MQRLIDLITYVLSSYLLPCIVHRASHVQLVHEIPDF